MPRRSLKPTPSIPPLPPFDERLRYRPDVAARFLDQSRATTFKQIKEGTLPVIREGKRVFVPGHVIVARCQASQS